MDKQSEYIWYDKPFRRIPEMSIETVLAEKDSIIWIGGTDGLYRYDGKMDNNDNKEINVLIRKVLMGKDSVIYHGSGRQNYQFAHDIEYKYNSIIFNPSVIKLK